MIQIVKDKITVTARKRHVCNYCNLIIEKGEKYEYTILKYDEIYSWKNHVSCNDIAQKLHMFSYADEGVNMEFFQETIHCEYQEIMSNEFNDLYESKEFKYPKWHEQLYFVIEYYKDKTKPIIKSWCS